jgi:hypothetical protein
MYFKDVKRELYLWKLYIPHSFSKLIKTEKDLNFSVNSKNMVICIPKGILLQNKIILTHFGECVRIAKNVTSKLHFRVIYFINVKRFPLMKKS